MIEDLISNLVSNPTEENKEKYNKFISQTEYNLLVDCENLPYKSQEYFSKRTIAFSFRGECAVKLISNWVSKYGTSEGCPVSYADTLNIPFREIKKPK
jgi:hypothetical protein